jgi:hypothetical protein
MEGVCTAHWLEADEVAHGAARIEAAVAEQREIDRAREVKAREQVAEAARLRALDPQRDKLDAVFRQIVERFWQEASAESGRNRALAGAAWAAGRLVAGGEFDEGTVTRDLVAEGVAAGLPAHEAKYVVGKQIQRARRQPRALARKSSWASDWGTRW